MIKYLTNVELQLIEEVKNLFEDLSTDLTELKIHELLLEDELDLLNEQKKIIKEQLKEYNSRKDEMIHSIIETYGEGVIDTELGTIEITE